MADSNLAEEWRPVVGYEGLYEVSDLGRVRALPRIRTNGQPIRGALVSGNYSKGYRHVQLSGAAGARLSRVGRRVSRLVLEAFVGPCPSGMEACHNNGARSDDRLFNLRWDTRTGNHSDKRQHGTLLVGERHPRIRLTGEVVRRIKALRESGLRTKEIASIVGVSKQSILRAIRYGGPSANSATSTA